MEAAQISWLAEGKKSSPIDPASQFWAVANIAARRAPILVATDANETGREILWCVRICLAHGIIAPEWLSDVFAKRFDAVFHAEVGLWSDPLAFGAPFPKGTHLSAVRKASKNGPKVVKAVEAILKESPQTPIDKSLFERVGLPLGLGSTLAEELYYEFRVNIHPSKKSRMAKGKLIPRKSKK